MTRKHNIAAAALAAALVFVGAAGAQPSGGGGPQQPDLPSLLHLRPDQMGAFHAYQASTRPHPDEIDRMRMASPQALSTLPTPQRLDRIGAFLNVQEQMFHRSADATRAFYGQLSPAQQQSFDRLTIPQQNGRRGGPTP